MESGIAASLKLDTWKSRTNLPPGTKDETLDGYVFL